MSGGFLLLAAVLWPTTVAAQVGALDLSTYRRHLESPCDLDVHGPKPCPGLERDYHAFLERHGLDEGPLGARIFAAYAAGDFRLADALYARATNAAQPEPPTTAIGRDPALADLRPAQPGEVDGCSLNPRATRPCLGVPEAWRVFRRRYRLPDTAESARIFEAYAEDDFLTGDRLFAEAKGVTLAQLLEAAGVAGDRLIIEVYPGPR